LKTLSFNAEQHEYRLTDDIGNVDIIPSVTQIVAAVTGKDLSDIPANVLDEARQRGNMIHADIEAGTMETPEAKWAEQFIPDRNETSFEGMEYAETNGLTYAGRYDIAIDGEIMDAKTQAEKDILGWTIQLNLYANFYSDPFNLSVLWVPKSGNFERVPIKNLSPAQLKEIADAYREGRRLPNDWLLDAPPEAASLELVIYNQTVGELTTNARAILAAVKKQLLGYKAENYTSDKIPEAKRDKAELNAAAKKLNDRRLELEREFNKPFAEFKDTITEACAEIKKASSLIDTVVKEVEDREKAEKRRQLEEAWNGFDCQLFGLEKIWRPEWLNKGYKNKDAVAEMAERIATAKADLSLLDRLGEPEAKAYYLSTLDMDSALKKADEIKANRERLAAIEKAREEAARAENERKADEQPKNSTAAPPSAPKVETKAEALNIRVVEPEEILERRMVVRATLAQLIALSQWMNDNGINFKKIEGGSF
jgi:hypothetical protein